MSRLYGPIVQVCYLVDEIEAGVHYWSDTLGAGPFFVLPPRRFERLEVHGRPAEDHAIIADVALGYAGDLQIELIVPGPAPSTYRDFLASGRSGLHHLGTAAHAFDAQRAAGIARGMTVVTEGASPLAPLRLYGRRSGPTGNDHRVDRDERDDRGAMGADQGGVGRLGRQRPDPRAVTPTREGT